MLTEKSLFEYRKQYPEDSCCFLEPGYQLLIENKVTNQSVISPVDETDELFSARLKRSKKKNINFFYIEYESYKPNPDVIY